MKIQTKDLPSRGSAAGIYQGLFWLVPVLRATGWFLGIPAGLLIGSAIMGCAPAFIVNASFNSVRYFGIMQLGMMASGFVFLTRKDDVQAGFDILSIISATVCSCATTAYFLS